MKQEDFFDEQIIDMINQAEQDAADFISKSPKEETMQMETEKSGIGTGVKILGKWIYFEKRLLANDTITMMLPKNFAPMSLEEARLKYPSEHRPETILTDETGTKNLLFQYMDGKVTSTTIESFRNQIFGMMKRVNPGIKEREIGTVNIAGKQIAYVEFSNTTMDGKLYNLMFYLAVNGQPLMGSFNCQTKEMKYWRDIVFEMIQSIEIIRKEEES